MECSKEDIMKMIKGKKKFFLKCFWVSAILFILSTLILISGSEAWANMAYNFYGIEKQNYTLIAGLLMGFWKILIIQFTLVPFIALFLAEKCMEKKEACE